MNVTIITSTLYPITNGAARILDYLLDELSKRDVSIELHYPKVAGRITRPNIEHYTYNTANSEKYNVTYPIVTKRISKRQIKPDVIHIITCGPWEYQVYKKLKGANTRVIISYYTAMADVIKQYSNGNAFGWVICNIWAYYERLLLSTSDRILTLNMRTLQSEYAEKIRTIYPGISSSNSILEDVCSAEGDVFSIAYIGRLSHEKDPCKMIDLLHWEPSFRVSIIGKGPLYKIIENLISTQELSDRIQLHGMLPHSRVLEMLHKVKVVVIPSKLEEFGLVALEAISRNCLVVALNGLSGIEYLASQFPHHVRIISSWEKHIVVPVIEDALASSRISPPMDWWSWKRFADEVYEEYSK